MGWQDRDWAKWTDSERDRYLGGGGGGPARSRSTIVPGAFLAVVVSLVSIVVFSQGPGGGVVPTPRLPALIYGSGLRRLGGDLVTCTETTNGLCTWTIVRAGQHVMQAAPLPAGVTCIHAWVDQHSGHWTCTAANA